MGHTYSTARIAWIQDESAQHGWTVTVDEKLCSNCKDVISPEIVFTRDSYKHLTATATFSDGEVLTESKIICEDITVEIPSLNVVETGEMNIVSGIEVGASSVDGLVELSDPDCVVIVTGKQERIGTGTKLFVLKDNYIVEEYTMMVYGDVNGDGWYDGEDAFFANMIANGVYMRAQLGEVRYLASDCNHDGVVDMEDVLILEQAGLLLADVDRNQTQAQLALDSVFIEYACVIDQSFVTDDVQPDTEETEDDTKAESETSPEKELQPEAKFDIFTFVIDFFKEIFKIISALFGIEIKIA